MMRSASTICAVGALVTVCAISPESVRAQAVENPVVERVGDTGFVQLRADSFYQLPPSQRKLSYWLAEAAIAIDPIIYDQLSPYGLRQKRVLEEIVGHSEGYDIYKFPVIRNYALLFWANRGNHNETTGQKFVPEFSPSDLLDVALYAQKRGGFEATYGDLPALPDPDAVRRELSDLNQAFFDANFQPTITVKTPPAGLDIIQASSNTFYQGVTLKDLQGFVEKRPLNSRVVKAADGTLHEEVYRAGTPDGRVPPGVYARYLKRAIEYLGRARAIAEPAQARVIDGLIRFYQTGEPTDWIRFGSDWVRNDATIDFANGFIEVYRDARGAKGSSQSFVTMTDQAVTTAMTKLAQNAAYFEQKAPWDAKYKKQSFQAPVVKAVDVLIETGDFHVTTIGDNLPNENEIHEMYGTKNFLLLGSSHALSAASAGKTLDEFAASHDEVERGKTYGEEADDMMTALHEVVGHGSGKLSERLTGGAGSYLKEYFSTLEEARADLMALWNIWDPKLVELGLVKNQEAVAQTMYDSAARVALTQLRRIPKGDVIEEDHQRNRQLIAHYIMDKTGAIERENRTGTFYYRVKDYQKMREGVGMLLSELMRIKAEGDYTAIKALVDQYGVHFDPAVRDQVVQRYRGLNLPTYWAGVNPRLIPVIDAIGNVTAVQIGHPRDAVAQYLAYGAMYRGAAPR